MSNVLDLTVDQGADYSLIITQKNNDLTPIDITGASFAGQVRSSYASDEIAFSFDFEITDAVNGEARATLTAASTSAHIITEKTSLVYDIEMTSAGGEVIKVMRGKLKLNPEVTK